MRLLQLTEPQSQQQQDFSPSSSTPNSRSTSSGVLVLDLSMAVVFAVLVLVPVCAVIEFRRRRRRRHMQEQQAWEGRRGGGGGAASSPSNSSDEDDDLLRRAWERRYHTVESWIVTKPAIEHDEVCQALTSSRGGNRLQTDGVVRVSGTASLEDLEADDDDVEYGSESGDRECPICFERLEAGELLSWSANPPCDHVFHHGCIKEWLVDRKDCPFCRTVFLPVDRFGPGDAHSAAHIPDLILGQKRRCAPCFYCLEHQVVRLPSSTQLNAMNVAPALRQEAEDRCAHVPDRTALTAIRRRIDRGEGEADRTDSGEGSGAGVAYDGEISSHVGNANPRNGHNGAGDDAAESASELCHADVECPDGEAGVRQNVPTEQELEYLDRWNVDPPVVLDRGPSADPCDAQDNGQV